MHTHLVDENTIGRMCQELRGFENPPCMTATIWTHYKGDKMAAGFLSLLLLAVGFQF